MEEQCHYPDPLDFKWYVHVLLGIPLRTEGLHQPAASVPDHPDGLEKSLEILIATSQYSPKMEIDDYSNIIQKWMIFMLFALYRNRIS